MKDIIIDNTNSNVVCYDSVAMNHANDSQIIKIINNNENINYVEILCRLWNFTKNEKLVYKSIINKLFNNEHINKKDIIDECVLKTKRNPITYNRAIDDLKEKGVVCVDVNGTINISNDYNIYNYINNKRQEKSIKYITLKI